LKIKDWRWLPGSNTKMIYTDEKGMEVLGPAIEIQIGKTLVVELSEGTMKDGYYHIIQVIGQI